MKREEKINQASNEFYEAIRYKSDLSGTPINAFKAGAEYADRTMIDKVCKYLYRKLENGKILSSQLIDDLRKYMEE